MLRQALNATAAFGRLACRQVSDQSTIQTDLDTPASWMAGSFSGFDPADRQVWGATQEGYIFRKVR